MFCRSALNLTSLLFFLWRKENERDYSVSSVVYYPLVLTRLLDEKVKFSSTTRCHTSICDESSILGASCPVWKARRRTLTWNIHTITKCETADSDSHWPCMKLNGKIENVVAMILCISLLKEMPLITSLKNLGGNVCKQRHKDFSKKVYQKEYTDSLLNSLRKDLTTKRR